MTEKESAIARLRSLIEHQLRWGDPFDWTQDDLDNLSDRIFDRTAVRLSVSTLKRIWGKVKYDSSPTMATLNALARFAGFEGWREYLQTGFEAEVRAAVGGATRPVEAKEAEESLGGSTGTVELKQSKDQVGMGAPGANTIARPETEPVVQTKYASQAAFAKYRKSRRLGWGLMLVLGVTVLIVLLGSRSSRKLPDPSTMVFESRKVTEDLPNSVVFTYDLGKFEASRVMIQQNWDTTRRELVDPHGHEHTSLYLYPGHFNARLLVDGQTVKMTEVFIKTHGWKGIIEDNPQPVYLSPAEIWDTLRSAEPASREKAKAPHPATNAENLISAAKPSIKRFLRVEPAVLKGRLATQSLNRRVVDLCNVRDFPDIPADQFTLKMSLRNTAVVEDCLCRKVRILVLGKGTAIIVTLADKGCSSDLSVYTGCEYISGKNHDLSGFGCDFRDDQEFECRVAGGRLYLLMNGRTVLDIAQPSSIGAIKGLRVEFEGGGEIHAVNLAGPARQLDLLDPIQAIENGK